MDIEREIRELKQGQAKLREVLRCQAVLWRKLINYLGDKEYAQKLMDKLQDLLE